jgi:putative long chain acyl-CoA synthase
MASVGSALASGARLALVERFDPESFETEVRRAGATLVFYAGDMLRPLVHRTRESQAPLPIRIFAGSGMRADLARKLGERFGVSTLEFYASTSQRAILANVDKKKPGALGRVLPGSDPVDVATVDLATKKAVRDSSGALVIAEAGEVGLLVVRDDGEWIVTSDVVRRDEGGDFWFVDSLSGFVRDQSTRQIEDRFYADFDVDVAAAYGVGGALWVAFVGEIDRERLAEIPEPRVVIRLGEIPLTEGFRPSKSRLPKSLDDPRIHEVLRRFVRA